MGRKMGGYVCDNSKCRIFFFECFYTRKSKKGNLLTYCCKECMHGKPKPPKAIKI